jgi:inosine-uridine nucleoside N-ribohydrolase
MKKKNSHGNKTIFLAFVALAGISALVCDSTCAAAPSARIPVILDTDIGDDIDDTWALVFALRCPELDLKLVVGDYGKPLYRARLLAKLLEAAARADVAVGLGVEFEAKQKTRQEKWIEDYNLDRYPGKVHRDGVQAIIDTILASKEPVTLICIGPVPNIAEALRREPRIAERARFVGMHGSVRVGYGGAPQPSAEWNVRAHPAACRAALTAPWDVTLTPLDTCGLVQLKGAKYVAVRDCGDPLVRTLMDNYRVWCDWNAAHGEGGHNPTVASSILYDPVAVYLAFARDFCVVERVGLRVDDDGHTREDANAKSMNAAVAWKNLPAFEDFLVQRLTGTTGAIPADNVLTGSTTEHVVTNYGAVPNDNVLDSTGIQAAIDACAAAGGGIVRIPVGRFVSSTVRMKDNVRLCLDKGAILEGSDNPQLYSPRNWNECLILFENVKNAGLEGPGLIDGKHLQDPQYPEKRAPNPEKRGPHLVWAGNCQGLKFSGLSLARAGNYAFCIRNTANLAFEGLDISEGFDGINIHGCSNVDVRQCRIRTGDDAVAGQSNRDVTFADCIFNSSCNGFRFSGIDVVVSKCRFYGPGEFPHLGGTDPAMDSAFVHFAPLDRPEARTGPPISDNWRIEDVTVDNVKTIYLYDNQKGTWQTGRPVKTVRFKNLKATRIQRPVTVVGDRDRQAELIFEQASIGFLGGNADAIPYAFHIRNASLLALHNVTVSVENKPCTQPVIRCQDVKSVILERFRHDPTQHTEPILLEGVDEVRRAPTSP